MPDDTDRWRSISCVGERCAICGEPAAAKVGEEIMHDDPFPNRHNLTAYVCQSHFQLIFGTRGVAMLDAMRQHKTDPALVAELLAACEAQHEAIDRLFAMLIQVTRGVPMEPFMPSQSGQPWDALCAGNAVIAKARRNA